MTLAELIAGATVLGLAAAGSLQVWSGSLAASQAVEHQQAQLLRLEAQLLRSGARLRTAAAQRLQAGEGWPTCGAAAAWMAAELEALGHQPELEPPPEALVRLVLRDPATGLERQRRWSPVAFGLCGGQR